MPGPQNGDEASGASRIGSPLGSRKISRNGFRVGLEGRRWADFGFCDDQAGDAGGRGGRAEPGDFGEATAWISRVQPVAAGDQDVASQEADPEATEPPDGAIVGDQQVVALCSCSIAPMLSVLVTHEFPTLAKPR
jgi:hypothetical protein